jgi:hypothetical protein
VAPPTSYSVQEIAAQQGRKTTPARADGFGGGEGAKGRGGEGARGHGDEGVRRARMVLLSKCLVV